MFHFKASAGPNLSTKSPQLTAPGIAKIAPIKTATAQPTAQPAKTAQPAQTQPVKTTTAKTTVGNFVSKIPNHGLGLAINDRLKKASKKYD